VQDGGLLVVPLSSRWLVADRECDLHVGAPQRSRSYIDLPAVRVDDLSYDCQAETGAPRLRREEGAEDLLGDVLGNARTIVDDVGHDRSHGLAGFAGQDHVVADRDESRSDRDVPVVLECLKRVDEEVGYHLSELGVIAWHARKGVGEVGLDDHVLTTDTVLVLGHGFPQDISDRDAVDLKVDRTNELELIDDDLVRHRCFADDVVEDDLIIAGHRSVALQQTGHDLDAGERVLYFVRNSRGHFVQRGQPVAESLALFELLDPRQILEIEDSTDHGVLGIDNPRDGVAEHFA